MTLKKSSFILLLILFIILVFIVGVRQGQRVEKTNKIIDYLISIPPSPTSIPTQKPPEFINYNNKLCGIQFLYPSTLQIEESTESALFTFSEKNKNAQVDLEIFCGQPSKDFDFILPSPFAMLLANDIASQEAIFKGKKITSKLLISENSAYGQPHLIFKISHPKTSKAIYVGLLKSLYPLFEKSLEFIP